MKVYHGSYIAIENVDFAFCRKRRDFGKGFYLTKIRLQAEYWAMRKGEDNDTDGAVTEFEFDESAFDEQSLKILRFKDYSEEWLDFVVKNRLNKTDVQIHDYDIIEGPVADDEVSTKVFAFVQGKISKESFLTELQHKQATHQICFCTLQSLQSLELNKGHIDVQTVDTENRIVQALMTEFKLDEMQAADIFYTSKTFGTFADENSKLYKRPWTEVYKLLKKEMQSA